MSYSDGLRQAIFGCAEQDQLRGATDFRKVPDRDVNWFHIRPSSKNNAEPLAAKCQWALASLLSSRLKIVADVMCLATADGWPPQPQTDVRGNAHFCGDVSAPSRQK